MEFLPPVQEVLPNLDQVVEEMGYREDSMDGYFKALAEKELENAASLIVPRAVYAEYDLRTLSLDRGCFTAGDRQFSPGARIFARLAKARKIVAFACTIGGRIGSRIRSLAEQGSAVQSYMLDVIAALAADNVAEAVQGIAEENASVKGVGCTERFSPGYCGWPVSAQEALFSLLPRNPCGISLNACAMMIPEKSVSGIFGVGPGLRRAAYGCDGCDKEDCPARRRMP